MLAVCALGLAHAYLPPPRFLPPDSLSDGQGHCLPGSRRLNLEPSRRVPKPRFAHAQRQGRPGTGSHCRRRRRDHRPLGRPTPVLGEARLRTSELPGPASGVEAGDDAARRRADSKATQAGLETPGCLRIEYRLPHERNV